MSPQTYTPKPHLRTWTPARLGKKSGDDGNSRYTCISYHNKTARDQAHRLREILKAVKGG